MRKIDHMLSSVKTRFKVEKVLKYLQYKPWQVTGVYLSTKPIRVGNGE